MDELTGCSLQVSDVKAAIETQVDAEKFQRDLLTIVCKGKVITAVSAQMFVFFWSSTALTFVSCYSVGPTTMLLWKTWASKNQVSSWSW